MINSIIQFTSKDYDAILADINAVDELADKPIWFKKLIAGIGDVFAMWNNAVANQSYLESAFTEEAVDNLLTLIDYQRTGRTTSSGDVLFFVNRSASFPFTVSSDDLIAYSEGNLSVASMKFEATADVTFTAVSETFTASGNLLTVARVYTTGELLRVSSDGTLPSPLESGTDYYAIYVSDTTIELAESLSDAYAGTNITLTDTGTGNHTIKLYAQAVTMYQRDTVDWTSIGTSDGVSSWQEFDLPDINVLEDTIEIKCNGLVYTAVDTFIYSIAGDRVFKVINLTDGGTRIKFPDGTYGDIPPAFDVYAQYAVGGGTDSNVSVQDRINAYGGTDSNISGVSNSATLTGGSDKQSINSARELAPILLKTRDRFVTVEDGESLCLSYGGISRAKVNKNIYGILSCQVVIVPNGGGTPSSALKTALQTYLIARTVLETIDVRVVDPTYVSTAITSQIKIKDGYNFSDIKPFYDLGLCLCFSEVTNEIKILLTDSGMGAVISYINTKWASILGYTFTTTDYSTVQTMLENVIAPNFGTTIYESDVLGFLDYNIDGIDYITMTAPTFPVTFDTDEITTVGTITTTEIT
jgi:hypothetical protein